MILKEIAKEISNGKQDVYYTEIVQLNESFPHKLKIDIRSDSYDFQSHAVIWRWDGTEWKVLHDIHYSKMQTAHGLAYKKDKPNENAFKQDRDKLLAVAEQVLA